MPQGGNLPQRSLDPFPNSPSPPACSLQNDNGNLAACKTHPNGTESTKDAAESQLDRAEEANPPQQPLVPKISPVLLPAWAPPAAGTTQNLLSCRRKAPAPRIPTEKLRSFPLQIGYLSLWSYNEGSSFGSINKSTFPQLGKARAGLGYLLEERGHGLALGGRDALHPVWRLHADDLWGKEDSPR